MKIMQQSELSSRIDISSWRIEVIRNLSCEEKIIFMNQLLDIDDKDLREELNIISKVYRGKYSNLSFIELKRALKIWKRPEVIIRLLKVYIKEHQAILTEDIALIIANSITKYNRSRFIKLRFPGIDNNEGTFKILCSIGYNFGASNHEICKNCPMGIVEYDRDDMLVKCECTPSCASNIKELAIINGAPRILVKLDNWDMIDDSDYHGVCFYGHRESIAALIDNCGFRKYSQQALISLSYCYSETKFNQCIDLFSNTRISEKEKESLTLNNVTRSLNRLRNNLS